MSNFPYNHHKYSKAETINGCPINFTQARQLAYEIRYWHGEEMDTDDWSQNSDAGEEDVTHLALGLMDLLSDPGAVKRLIASGKDIKQSVGTLMAQPKVDYDEPGFYANARKVVERLFIEAPENTDRDFQR